MWRPFIGVKLRFLHRVEGLTLQAWLLPCNKMIWVQRLVVNAWWTSPRPQTVKASCFGLGHAECA